MVFAVWAGAPDRITPQVRAAFQESCAFGLQHLHRIASQEAARRSLSPELAREYLNSHIVFEAGEPERQGMELFLKYARELPARAEALMVR
jgi:predicted solute-binding protein